MKRLHQDFYIGIAIILISAYFLYRTQELPEGADIFPTYIFGILIFFGVLIAFAGFRKRKPKDQEDETANDEIDFYIIRKPLLSFILIFIYGALIVYLGFFVSTSIFIAAFMIFYGIKKPVTIVLIVLSVDLFIYLLFVYQLNVRLPAGFLF